MTINMVRDLVAHKGYADAALLNAIRVNDEAVADREVLDLLHHVLIANRFWLLTVQGRPFDHQHEARRAPQFDALIERYADTHAQETAWLAAATGDDIARTLAGEQIPGGRCSVAQAFVQVCLHGNGHRAQCAKLLRRRGIVPPSMDFIAWLPHRPAADWR